MPKAKILTHGGDRSVALLSGQLMPIRRGERTEILKKPLIRTRIQRCGGHTRALNIAKKEHWHRPAQ